MADDRARMLELRFGYFPRLFTWRGGRWAVTAVRRVWCETREWPRLRQARVFSVETRAGVFELSHNLRRDTWTVRRWPAAARRRISAAAQVGVHGGGAHGRGLAVAR